MLEVGDRQLRQIKLDNNKACLHKMLRVWLSRVDPPPSWSDVAEALEFLKHEDLATNLRSILKVLYIAN